jgi:uncharacterized protein
MEAPRSERCHEVIMRTYHADLLLSASDLMNYLGCQHCSFLDLHRAPDTIAKTETDPEAELLKKKGLEHEQRYRDRLIANGTSVTQIITTGELDTQVTETLTAIRRGDPVIYQATLLRNPWHGYIDFLERVPTPSALGSFSYEITDTKLAHSPKPQYLVQLCVYGYLLEVIQGAAPRAVHLVLGDGKRISFRMADFFYYVEVAREALRSYVANPPLTSQPMPCIHCDQCHWKDRCGKEWELADHLWLIANIQRSQIQKLNAAGLQTVHAFAATPDTLTVSHIGPDTLNRLRSQARLQVQKKDTGKDIFELLPIEQGRGFCRLPKADPGDLFFDMEGDPHFPDGLEYLFGFSLSDNQVIRFVPFWAHDRSQEKVAFEQAMDFIVARLKQHPDAYVYHYAQYEPTALKRLAAYHGTREEELDWLLRNQKFVDLFKVVREGIRTSQPGYSLKDLEIFYFSGREGSVTNAGDSIVMYENYCATQDASLLEQIRAYNYEDCRSTLELRNWLLTLRPVAATWFVPAAKVLDAEKLQAAVDAQSRRQALEQKLIACDAQLKGMHELVSQLLDFHRREQKPQWWRIFDWQDRTDEELVEDFECLGALTLSSTKPPYREVQSSVYTYQFPEQETKLDAGDTCYIAATLERAGEIVSMDLKACTVAIKRGIRSGPLPRKLSVTPEHPFNVTKLREALDRFGEAEAASSGTYSAARSLLLRELPRITGVRHGQPVVPAGPVSLKASIEAVGNLRDSYLLIQGPPGSGKTYTASHIIVEMLRRGKRVGVASNSHKAIHNLLTAVESLAAKQGISFRGVKKATGNNDESFFRGKFTTDVTRTSDVTQAFQLVAGTVYMYAELADPVDYLFVDEAGQVCLANAVIMAMCTRNLVLIGDQMQLAQPIQGVHPGKSGLSVLEYLLEDQATIPPDRGIFLETTYRMHEDVCRFISDAVYDGRLQPQSKNQNQSLVLNKTGDAKLRPAGIRFIEVNHQGCSQRSEEEGAVIKSLFSNLLKQKYCDRDGHVNPITPANIIVITPYNMQVNYLTSILPAGTRVGTVDKLQGQEAEVVLVSMATSSGEDLPRDIEFLYSKNRLNVAISRARILACIVASPRLLQIQCNTVEQLKLVNTLCWAKRYASRM